MDHVRGRRQVKTGSGGLQGKNEYLVLPAVLETGHHLVALLDRAASVIEHRSLARPVTDKLHEHLAHLLELREHQHLLAGVHDPVQPVKKHLHLAGKRRRHIPVLQVLRRMVAYLLQRQNHLKDKALPFEKRGAVGSVLAFDLSHRRIQRLVVQGRLLRRKGRIFIDLDLVRKVADDSHVGLHPPHHKRSRHLSEPRGALLIVVQLDRVGIFTLERFEVTEVTAVGIVHYAPELGQAVLDRGAAERDLRVGGDGADSLALDGGRVLDVLRLIDHHHAPLDFREDLLVRTEHAVGREQDVHTAFRPLPTSAVIDERGQAWSEPGDLRLPVGKESCRHDHKRRLLPQYTLILHLLQQSDGLERLA